MSLTQYLRRAAQLDGPRTAVVYGDLDLDWRTLAGRVAKLAGALRGLGVRADDRVAMLGLNSHRSIEAHYAAMWAGAVMVPLNHRLAAEELAVVLQDAEPAVLIVEPEFRALARAASRSLPAIPTIVIGAEAGDGVHDYETLLEGAAPIDDCGRSDDDAACLYYTGGTTGRPKGVVLTHGNLIANAFNFIVETGIDEDLVHLHCGPFFHVAAGARIFIVTMVLGTHIVLPRFAARPVLAAIERHRVTMATFVPTMVKHVLDELDAGGGDVSSLASVTYGAAPMPEELLLRLMRRLPEVGIVQLYGQTELSPTATMLGARDHVLAGPRAGKLRSAGRAVTSAEVRVVDADDRPLGVGEIGEVVVRGPMVMREYWRQPELTAQAKRGGWMHTGDMGYLDADGYLFVVDRLKDMIVSGGENVYSTEVENAIHRHPGVAECAVFGIPDATWGEAVHAVVVPKPGVQLDAATLREHCRAHIADYKCPRSIEIRTDPLPLTGTNKILKSALKAPYWRK